MCHQWLGDRRAQVRKLMFGGRNRETQYDLNVLYNNSHTQTHIPALHGRMKTWNHTWWALHTQHPVFTLSLGQATFFGSRQGGVKLRIRELVVNAPSQPYPSPYHRTRLTFPPPRANSDVRAEITAVQAPNLPPFSTHARQRGGKNNRIYRLWAAFLSQRSCGSDLPTDNHYSS